MSIQKNISNYICKTNLYLTQIWILGQLNFVDH